MEKKFDAIVERLNRIEVKLERFVVKVGELEKRQDKIESEPFSPR